VEYQFIRFNPDNYKNHETKLVKSYKGREKKLLDILNGLKNRNEIKIPLSVYYLFYDGYDGIDRLEEMKYI